MNRVLTLLLILLTALGLAAGAAAIASGYGPAALTSSPGPLNRAHLVLDKKANNCLACHNRWQKVDAQKCLVCHDELSFTKHPLTANRLFHRDLVPKRGDCLACHNEHRGTGVSITRDGAKIHLFFTGSELKECVKCHLPEKGEHLRKQKNPYNGECSECHTTVRWKPSVFSHCGR